MSFAIKTRLPKLERSARAERKSAFAEISWEVFQAMRVSDEDFALIEAVLDRGEPFETATPLEQAASERFSKELEAAVLKVSGRPLSDFDMSERYR